MQYPCRIRGETLDQKNTDNLKQELMAASDLNSFLSENETCFESVSVKNALNRIFKEKNITKSELAVRSNVSEVYLHQIFSGRRIPTRDKLICLCIGLSASLDETQTLLKNSGYAQLYTKDRRDAIIMYSLINGIDVVTTNNSLKENSEFLLF